MRSFDEMARAATDPTATRLAVIYERYEARLHESNALDFDDLLLKEIGERAGTCIYGNRCHDYVVVEHNGDIYPCDFFVQPRWKLGNIMESSLAELVQSEKYQKFAAGKSEVSPQCEVCTYLPLCYGGCQKHRTVLGDPVDTPTYFCKAYQQLFEHTKDRLKRLARVVRPQE